MLTFELFISNLHAAVPEMKLEAGDKMLLESVTGEHKIYHLWRGNGKRDDDPLNELDEIYDRRIRNVSRPSLMMMRPKVANGKAVLVFPGGGYKHLAAKKEGSLVGEWLNKQGITAFIVKYRVPKRDKINASLQDAQRAVRFVRYNAKKFGIKSSEIGVMGFSAGGHLCATLIQHSQNLAYKATDPIDAIEFHPNFCALIYPAYLDQSNSKLTDIVKSDGSTIPLYVTISKNDGFLNGVENFIGNLRESGVKVDYNLYQRGGHGSGLYGFPWIESFKKWLTQM